MKNTVIGLVALATVVTAAPLAASPAIFSGFDSGATSRAGMTNSLAAAAAFNAAVTGQVVDTFDPASPQFVFSGTGVGFVTAGDASCGALCGYNTTIGGQNFFQNLTAGQIVITPVIGGPVTAFGFFLTGVQGPTSSTAGNQTVTIHTAAGDQVFTLPAVTGGGGEFWGFVDLTTPILYAGINPLDDQIGIDDIIAATALPAVTAVPEPVTLTLFAAGLVGAGVMRRRKARKA